MNFKNISLAILLSAMLLSPLSHARAQVDSSELNEKAKDVGTSVFGTLSAFGKKYFGTLEKYRLQWGAAAKIKHDQYTEKTSPDKKTPQFAGALAFFYAAVIVLCGSALIFYGVIVVILYLILRHFWSSAV